MQTDTENSSPVKNLDILLERDLFMRSLIRELADLLEDVVGYQEASGYISLVGQNIGDWLNGLYRKALSAPMLSRTQVADALVDLKARINGDFYIIEQDDDKIVLGNHACPFAEKVVGRPSMCMMTSNVFGAIAAENLGYAKVELQETIAAGHTGCKVAVYLTQTLEADAADGREYFQTEPDLA